MYIHFVNEWVAYTPLFRIICFYQRHFTYFLQIVLLDSKNYQIFPVTMYKAQHILNESLLESSKSVVIYTLSKTFHFKTFGC